MTNLIYSIVKPSGQRLMLEIVHLGSQYGRCAEVALWGKRVNWGICEGKACCLGRKSYVQTEVLNRQQHAINSEIGKFYF